MDYSADNNYGRSDTRLANPNVLTGYTGTPIWGFNITAKNWDSRVWWSDTAKYPAALWVLADNKLPTLKTDDGKDFKLIQTPKIMF